MTIFGAIDTSGSGLTLYRKWMDAISDNMSNLNTVQPTSGPAFQERLIVARAVGRGDPSDPSGTGGVAVDGVQFGDATGRLVHDPSHPLADANGDVRLPSMDLADQMTNLIMAQRGYQANLAVVERARDAYQAALSIGK